MDLRELCEDHGRKGFGLGYATAIVAGRTTTLHRKVHFEATGEWPEIVRHTCDNPRCINPAHLVGGTQVDNMRDMRERGRGGDCRNFGEDNGRSVLSDNDCSYMRTHYVRGSREFGLPALARKFGCSISQVYRVVKGEQRAT